MQNSIFEEIPNKKKIVEKCDFFGKIKVVASWYFIWNTIHQIILDILVAIVVCNIFSICTRENISLITNSRILIAVCTSIININMRMDSKAKRRWKEKYEPKLTK
ncbi:hypothetical protein [Nostoc sp. MS1]|uniref:hypothetical protein n=1 Tax=Nostoc sp. MS1 TaxID=2764711 RepID=UPI001CC4643F|nr:hypothetical protein [Nostoc sp. MS1]BCL37913.1 hypothetical protein NSMS1_43600 [Nostoc sp. MS1]